LRLFGRNFCSQAPIEKKLYSHEDNQYFYLPKEFQKIMTKIQPVGTCPKSHLFPEWTMVLLGLKKTLYCSLLGHIPQTYY